MSLTLYYHPLASFCHKVLIALYENGTPFEGRVVDLADETSSAEMMSFWPVGKFPVLHDTARSRIVPETTILLEYLDEYHPGPVRLLPSDPEMRLEARLWDRFFDLYVSAPLQKIVGDRLRPADDRDPWGVEEARRTLRTAYSVAEKRLSENAWAGGSEFGLADCAAFPALFYVDAVAPFTKDHPALAAYFERLLGRPSVKRVLDEARPWIRNFPFHDDLQERFQERGS